MDNIQELRQKCISANQQCDSAVQHAKQVESAAAQQRQIALTNARQKHTQMQQDVRNVLNELNRLTSQAQLILTELGLKARGGSATPPQSSVTLNNLIRMLHNYQGEAKTSLLRLKAAADELKEERRKWWKFW